MFKSSFLKDVVRSGVFCLWLLLSAALAPSARADAYAYGISVSSSSSGGTVTFEAYHQNGEPVGGYTLQRETDRVGLHTANYSYPSVSADADGFYASATRYAVDKYPVTYGFGGYYTERTTTTEGAFSFNGRSWGRHYSGTAPVISQQPQGQTAFPGQRVVLSVKSDKTSASYQWTKDGIFLPPSASPYKAELVLPAFRPEDAGRYSVLVYSGGSTWSDEVDVSAAAGDNAAPPTVTLTSSSVNLTAPATFTLTAAAADADGIAKVEFYQGANRIATATTAPYTLTLTTNVIGSHAFTAKAYDTKGAATLSALVMVGVHRLSYGTVQFDAASYTDSTDSGVVNVRVTRMNGSDNEVTVAYSSAVGSGTLTWADGDSTPKVIPLNGDVIVTTTPISLATPTGGATLGTSATANLTPASYASFVSFVTSLVLTDDISRSAALQVTRTGSRRKAASIEYATASGTAIAGQDFLTTSGTIQWAAGEAGSKTIEVPLLIRNAQTAGNVSFRDFSVALKLPTSGLQIGNIGTASIRVSRRTLQSALFGAGSILDGQLGTGNLGITPVPVQVSNGVRSIATKGSHSLVVKADGTLWAMGDNRYGQLGDTTTTDRSIPVQVATGVASVAAGFQHSLFLKTDGTLWVMGYNSAGQLGDGTTSYIGRSTPVQVATGVASVAAGGYHSLFVKTDRTLWAMGYNSSGQLGDSTTTDRSTPVQVATGVASVAAGYTHSLYVKTDGTLWAMGANSYGQLGDATTTSHSTPVQVAAGVAFVAAGYEHSLFVKTDGTLWAMGQNIYQQLGDGTTTGRSTPVQVATGVASVAAGSQHSLYVKTDGTLWAMGANSFGQLGDGTRTDRSTPVQVATGVASAAAGWWGYFGGLSLFVRVDGTLWAMGADYSGVFGMPDKVAYRSSPIQITTADTSVISIAAGGSHSLFVKMDGTLWAMGYNGRGQLGAGTISDIGRSTPVQVTTGVASVAAGGSHSLFVKADGTLWAMGANSYGQLGDGTTTDRPAPVQVAIGVAAVATGRDHSLFVKSDKTLWAMGSSYRGALGDGTASVNNYRSLPVQVASGVASVTAGSSHSLFVKLDGTLWSMGNNGYGQLGDGTDVDRSMPVQVATGVASVAAGSLHSLFVKVDGTLWEMGNTSGYSPWQVATGVASVAAGDSCSLFVKTDGTLWAMGYNGSGQLGDGTTTERSDPVQVAAGVAAVVAGSGHSLFVMTVSESIIQFHTDSLSVGEGSGNARLKVFRRGSSDQPVQVSFSSAPITATTADFTAVSGTLSWAANDSTDKFIDVPILEDTVVDGNKTFTVTLSAPTGGAVLGTPATTTVTIVDNDEPPAGTLQFSASNYTVAEGAGSVTLSVTRANGSYGVVEVTYSANNVTALAGQDYTAVSGLLRWADGVSTAQTITVPILEDTEVEGSETFTVTLSQPAGRATLGTPVVATVTITDNDVAPPGTLQFTNAAVTVSEGVGTLELTVVRLGGTNGAVGVSYAATNGTAVVFEDYLSPTGTLHWAAGDDAPQLIRIPIIDDGRVETNETFTVTLSAPTGGAALGTPSVVTVTILDNDTNAPPAGNFAWVVRAAATNATVSKVVSDAAGNLYAAGYFSGTLQLGSQTFTSQGARAEAWVTKLDGAGNVVWAKSYGSTGDDRAQGIAVDGSGSVVVVGRFSGTVNFGGTNVTGLGLSDVFILKLDGAGNTVWVRRAGGEAFSEAKDVAVDGAGNIVVAGNYEPFNADFGTTVFDDFLAIADVFVTKVDRNGNFLWATSAGGVSTEDDVQSVQLDAAGNAYITGTFGAAIDGLTNVPVQFGAQVLTGSGKDADIFVAKLNGAGVFQWVRRIGGAVDEYLDASTTDSAGNTLLAVFTLAADVRANGTLLTNLYPLVQFDSAGNLVAEQALAEASSVTALAPKTAGQWVMAGGLFNGATFGTNQLVVLGGSDVLVGQLESPGMNQTAFAAGGTGDDLATAVAPATNGLYVAGNFSGNATFGTRNLTGGGLFFARLGVTNAVTVVVTNSPATIVLQPTNRTVTAGQTATFTGAAGGTPTPTLLWQRSVNGGTTWTNLANGVGFAGVATGTLQVSGTTTAQSGHQFRLTATNNLGGAVSTAAILTVNPTAMLPAITLAPAGRSVTAGATATFDGTASGTPAPTLLWQRSVNGGTTWTNLTEGGGFAGVATGTLQVTGTTTAQSGQQFRLTATNTVGGAVSTAATLTVNPATTAPVITQGPQSRTVAAGSNVTFTVSATGTSPTYFWRKDGALLPTATNPSLTVSNVTRAASGIYSVILTNSSGSVTSAPALLRVLVPQRVEGGTNLHRLPDGRFQIHFRDPDGTLASDLSRFEIHSTTNLIGAGTIWVTNTTGLSIINGLIRFEDASSTNLLRRFYRVIER